MKAKQEEMPRQTSVKSDAKYSSLAVGFSLDGERARRQPTEATRENELRFPTRHLGFG